MEFKKLQLQPPLSFDRESVEEIRHSLKRAFASDQSFSIGTDVDVMIRIRMGMGMEMEMEMEMVAYDCVGVDN